MANNHPRLSFFSKCIKDQRRFNNNTCTIVQHSRIHMLNKNKYASPLE